MNDIEKKELKKTACRVRMGRLDATYAAQSGHPGGSLSAADLFTYLYFRELRIDPKNPKWEDRDRFVLSKGHTAPGLYSGENRDCSRYRGAGETSRSHAWAVEASIGDKNTAGTANGYLGYW